MNIEVVNKTEILGQEIQVYGDFDNPLFLARDVANWIEHSKQSVMIETVDDDEKLKETIFTSGQNREMWLLTEDGLYEVLMQSRKPIAKEFKKKIKAMLKGLRKGELSLQPTKEEEKAQLLLKVYNGGTEGTIAAKRISEIEVEEATLPLLEEIEVAKPKVEYHDEILNCDKLITTTDIAKDLGMSASSLNNILHKNKIIYPKMTKKFNKKKEVFEDKKSHWLPYSDYQFLIEEKYADYKIDLHGQQLRWTEKGRQWIIEFMNSINDKKVV